MRNLFICFLQKLHGLVRVAFRFSYKPLFGGAAKWENVSFDFKIDWFQSDKSERLSRDDEGSGESR